MNASSPESSIRPQHIEDRKTEELLKFEKEEQGEEDMRCELCGEGLEVRMKTKP